MISPRRSITSCFRATRRSFTPSPAKRPPWLAFSGNTVPIFDRLFLGGANNLRGFKYRDVGPKDQFGDPIGGDTLARITAEYTFPVMERVRGAIFYDTGIVNSGNYSFSTSNINSDIGLGACQARSRRLSALCASTTAIPSRRTLSAPRAATSNSTLATNFERIPAPLVLRTLPIITT